MKRLFIIGLSLTVSSLAFKANAQTATGDKMRFGIKAGPNLMNMGTYTLGEEEYSTKSKVGFQAGVYGELPMGGNFAFLPEATYIQKGAKLKETIAGTTGEIDTKVSYLDIPLMIGYRATPELTVFAGPQVSFLLSQTSVNKINGEQEGDDNTSTENFNKSLAGAALGLGYSITPNINVNARYMMDFQKTLKDDQNQDKIKNKGFALSLGYSF